MLEKVMQFDWVLILLVLFGISESLALIPQVKSNSVFQLIFNSLKFIKDKIAPKK